jgi:hypothetical protein
MEHLIVRNVRAVSVHDHSVLSLAHSPALAYSSRRPPCDCSTKSGGLLSEGAVFSRWHFLAGGQTLEGGMRQA